MKGAALVFTLCAALYTLLRQEAPYGDGIGYMLAARAGELYSLHLLWMPSLVGFTRLCELAGIADADAAFVFDALCAAAGCALCWLTLRRIGVAAREAAALVAVLMSAPVTVFFATTVENHAQHFAWVSLALLACARVAHSERPLAWLGAGFAIALAPLSHQTGWLLVPGLWLWLAARARGPDLSRLVLALAPSLLLFATDRWLRVTLFGNPEVTGARETAQMLEDIVERGLHLATWPGFLWNAALVPAFGLWLCLAACARALPRARVLVALGPPILVLTLFNYREEGAYFLGLLPLALAFAADARRGAGRWLIPLCLVLVPAELLVGQARVRALRAGWEHPPWVWAAEADAIARGLERPGETSWFLVADGKRWLHLIYDQRRDARFARNEIADLVLPRLAEDPAGGAGFVAATLRELAKHGERGPVLASAALVGWIDRKFPALGAAIRREFRLVEVARGKTRLVRVAAR